MEGRFWMLTGKRTDRLVEDPVGDIHQPHYPSLNLHGDDAHESP
jgi:hypothetical protein